MKIADTNVVTGSLDSLPASNYNRSRWGGVGGYS